MPASISARARHSRSCCCASREPSRRSATRCCSRPPTSASSVCSSTSTSVSDARQRSACAARHHSRVSHPASPRRAWRSTNGRCARRGARGGVVTVHSAARRRPGPPGRWGQRARAAARRRRRSRLGRRRHQRRRPTRPRASSTRPVRLPSSRASAVVARHIEQFARQDDVAFRRIPRRPARHDRAGARCLRHQCTKALVEAVKKTGPHRRHRSGPRTHGVARGSVQEAGVKLDQAARELVVERLGEDLGPLCPRCSTRLEATYGPGARLSEDDVEPFLGEAGGVPPWELTDAIDRGDTAAALDRLARMMGGGERHPLQIRGDAVRPLRACAATVGQRRDRREVGGRPARTCAARRFRRKALDQGAASRSAGCGEGLRAVGRRRSRHAWAHRVARRPVAGSPGGPPVAASEAPGPGGRLGLLGGQLLHEGATCAGRPGSCG